jgi:hypothetical protein
MQYITGTFQEYNTAYSGNRRSQCMLAKITSRGDFEDASLLSHTSTNDDSNCNALVLTPKVDNVVAVGWVYIDALTRTTALLI